MTLGGPTGEHEFANHMACLDFGMGSSKISRIDWGERFGQRGLDLLSIDPFCNPREKLVLFNHVFGLIHRTRKHEFPRKSRTLSLQCIEVDGFRGVNDSANAALRFNGLAHSLPMLVGLRSIENILDHGPM